MMGSECHCHTNQSGIQTMAPWDQNGTTLSLPEQGVRHHWQVLDKYQCLLLVISEQIPVIGPITVKKKNYLHIKIKRVRQIE